MSTVRKFGSLQAGIVVLALATALIHFYLNVIMGKIDALFTMNALGYIGLTGALYLPLPFFKDNRRLLRFAFIAYTLLTIILWVFLGRPYTTLGYITKVIEAALVFLLFYEKP